MKRNPVLKFNLIIPMILGLLFVSCEETMNPIQSATESKGGIFEAALEGEDCTGFISGVVWNDDATPNGLMDVGEPFVDSLKVELEDSNGVSLFEVFTNGDGFYAFDSLCAGTYVVEFKLPEGYTTLAPGSDPAEEEGDEVEVLFETDSDTLTLDLPVYTQTDSTETDSSEGLSGDDDDDDDDDDFESTCETDSATARQAIDDALLALADAYLFFDGDTSGLDLTEVYEKLDEAAEKLAEA
ncbi:MAG: SdrD B-like domain-containing protein, partial [Planctomycetota bacterium]